MSLYSLRTVDWCAIARGRSLEEAVASALAKALVSCGSVLFLHSDPRHDNGTNEWKSVSPQTWQMTKQVGMIPKLGRKWRFCLSSNPDSVRQLFHDDQYSWHLRGQLALLFPSGQRPENLPLNEIVRCLEKQELTNVADCTGYLRPGDDGDFAEFGPALFPFLISFVGA